MANGTALGVTGGVTGGSPLGTASDLATRAAATRSSHDASRIRSGTRSSLRRARFGSRRTSRFRCAITKPPRTTTVCCRATSRRTRRSGTWRARTRASPRRWRAPERGAAEIPRRQFHSRATSTGHRLCFRRRRRRAPQDVFVVAVEHDEGSARDVGDGRVDVARLALSLFVPRRRRRAQRSRSFWRPAVRGRMRFERMRGGGVGSGVDRVSARLAADASQVRRARRARGAQVRAGRGSARTPRGAPPPRSPCTSRTPTGLNRRTTGSNATVPVFPGRDARQDAVGARARAPALRAGEADREVRELAAGGGALRQKLLACADGVSAARAGGACAGFCFSALLGLTKPRQTRSPKTHRTTTHAPPARLCPKIDAGDVVVSFEDGDGGVFSDALEKGLARNRRRSGVVSRRRRWRALGVGPASSPRTSRTPARFEARRGSTRHGTRGRPKKKAESSSGCARRARRCSLFASETRSRFRSR